MRPNRFRLAARIIFIRIIPLVIIGIFVFGATVMALWNALLPGLFHFPVINFWQALGLLILSKIFFGGFRGPGRPWRSNKMREKWASMSPEEQERFRQQWGRRCGKGFQQPGSEGAAQGPETAQKEG